MTRCLNKKLPKFLQNLPKKKINEFVLLSHIFRYLGKYVIFFSVLSYFLVVFDIFFGVYVKMLSAFVLFFNVFTYLSVFVIF